MENENTQINTLLLQALTNIAELNVSMKNLQNSIGKIEDRMEDVARINEIERRIDEHIKDSKDNGKFGWSTTLSIISFVGMLVIGILSIVL